MAPVPEPVNPADLIKKRREYLDPNAPLRGDDRIKAEAAREEVARQSAVLEKQLYEEHAKRTGFWNDSNYVSSQMYGLLKTQAQTMAQEAYIYSQKPEELGAAGWQEVEKKMLPLIEKTREGNQGFNAHRNLLGEHLNFLETDIKMKTKLADKEAVRKDALERWNLSSVNVAEFMKANPLPENATEEQQEASRIKLVTQPVKPGEEARFEAYVKNHASQLQKLPDSFLDGIKKYREEAAKVDEPALPGAPPPPAGPMFNAPAAPQQAAGALGIPPAPPRTGREM